MSDPIAESPVLVNATLSEGVTRGNVYLVDPRQLKVDWTKNISRGCTEPPVDESLIALAKDMISSPTSGESAEGSSGQLNPILVRIMGKGQPFEVVGGFRRLRAALWLIESGTCTDFRIKYSVSRMTEAEAAIVNTVENLHREDPKPIQIAYAIRSLNEGYCLDMKTIASRLRKSPAWCKSMLELLSLPKPIQDKVSDGTIKPGAAMELAKLPEAKQAEALSSIVENGGKVTPAKVRAVREKVRAETGQGDAVKRTVKQLRDFLRYRSCLMSDDIIFCGMLTSWLDGETTDCELDDHMNNLFEKLRAPSLDQEDDQ